MNLVIPPVIFYLVGFALIVGGILRAVKLGRRNPEREIGEDGPARVRARRRHLVFGFVWVAMGLFLIGSTVHVLRSKTPVPPSPVLRLAPATSTSAAPPARP